MSEDEAQRILSVLVGATSGWQNAPDETFRFYLAQIGTLKDVEAAQAAAHEVGRTWTEPRRPPIAELNRAYTAYLRQRAINTPTRALHASAGTVDVAEGRRIAYAAYEQTVKAANREPRTQVIESLLGSIGGET